MINSDQYENDPDDKADDDEDTLMNWNQNGNKNDILYHS